MGTIVFSYINSLNASHGKHSQLGKPPHELDTDY